MGLASNLFIEKVKEAGWTCERQVEVLLQYIENQQCGAAFEDFLDRQIAGDKELSTND